MKLALITVMMFVLVSVAVIAAPSVTMNIMMHEQGLKDRSNEPIKLDVSSVTCAFSDKHDLRIYQDGITEIPVQVLSDYNTAVFVVNVSDSFDGIWGTLTCNDPEASEPTYDTGFSVTEKEPSVYHVEIGTDGIVYDYFHSGLQNYTTTNTYGESYGVNLIGISGALWLTSWDGNLIMGGTVGDYRGTCSLSDVGPVYAKMTCTNSDINGDYSLVQEIYMKNPLVKWTPSSTSPNGVVIFGQYGGGATPDPWGEDYAKFFDGDYNVQSWRTSGDPQITYLSKGLVTFAPAGSSLGVGLVYDESYVWDGVQARSSLGMGGGGSYGNDFYFCLGAEQADCGASYTIDVNRMGATDAKTWFGYIPFANEDALVDTYVLKMNPVEVSLEAPEVPEEPYNYYENYTLNLSMVDYYDNFDRNDSPDTGNLVKPADRAWYPYVECDPDQYCEILDGTMRCTVGPSNCGGGSDLWLLLFMDPAPIYTSGIVTAEFDYNQVAVGAINYNQPPGVWIGTTFEHQGLNSPVGQLVWWDTNLVKCRAGTESDGVPFELGEWAHYKWVTNLDTQTWSAYKNGVPICEDMAFADPNIHQIDVFNLFEQWATDYRDSRADNLVIYAGTDSPYYIPEPEEPEEEESSSSHTRYLVDASGNVVGVQYGNQLVTTPQQQAPFLSLMGGEQFDLVGWLKGLWAQLMSLFGGN